MESLYQYQLRIARQMRAERRKAVFKAILEFVGTIFVLVSVFAICALCATCS